MTGNRNRTLRMYSAIGGLVVVGVIALFTALGHHPTPSVPTGNLYTASGDGGLSVVTPTPTPTPSHPWLWSKCHYDAAATAASPAEYNMALYRLSITNPGSTPVRVASVRVKVYQASNGHLAGTDDPYYPTGYPWMPGWKPVTIAPGATVHQVLPMHLLLNFAGAWTCSLASYSETP